MAFETKIANDGEYSVIILKDNDANTFAEIFSFGALLNKFSVVNNEESLNVIEGFADIADTIENLTPYFKSAKLSPYVCRVKNAEYIFGESTYQLSKYYSNQNSIHGLLYDCPFQVTDHQSSASSASVKLAYQYNKVQEGFPFKYRCEVEYTLQKGNSLTINTIITNLDIKLMPVTDGWHPYFTLGDSIDDYLVEFQSKDMLEFDENLIPTGKFLPYEEFGSLKKFGNTRFDNCFTLNFSECQPLCVIRNPGKNVQVEFYPEESYPYLQIYTPDSRKSIAIENLSAAPDAFNNGMGLKVLSPGEQAIFSTKFIIRSL